MNWAEIVDDQIVSIITAHEQPANTVPIPEGLNPFRMRWTGTELVADEEEDLIQLEATMRWERDQRLISSDWTQLPDAPVDQAAWATYRQALRDLPNHVNWPNLTEDDWPVPPEG